MADIVSFSKEKEKVKSKKEDDSGGSDFDTTLQNIIHELHFIQDHSKGALIPILSYVEGYRVGLEKSSRRESLYSAFKKALEDYRDENPEI
ncbi:hypothetical protein [Desulfospira joergensenii]|uniref:hypothetical protein n=1 Tax=Desulfospira joergensenii TaxID=53329 RepID=UPI0003B343B5|nr:hypothetical protein [Desulfospira joergensenii]